MAKCEQCPHCGANLDFGEKCDCNKKRPPEEPIRDGQKDICHNS